MYHTYNLGVINYLGVSRYSLIHFVCVWKDSDVCVATGRCVIQIPQRQPQWARWVRQGIVVTICRHDLAFFNPLPPLLVLLVREPGSFSCRCLQIAQWFVPI